jgi:RNA polymerase sigma factor (sigma-70 family)
MTAPGESRAVSSTGPTGGPVVSARTSAGSPPADAAALYERYGNRIFRYCLQRLHSVEEAEDAAQTAFLYAFVGLSRGVEPEFEVAWLYKIAENVCRTRIRSRARRGRFEASGELFELLDVIPAADRTKSEAAQALPEIILSSMPPSQRRALLLREVQGLSYREIAEQLRTSVSAVETLLFRARRSCARELERLASPAERTLSAASLVSAVKSVVSRYLAASSGAKVAVLAAAAATGGALVATPRLVEHHHAGAPVTSKARSPAAPVHTPAPTLQRTSPVMRRSGRQTEDAKPKSGPAQVIAPVDAPHTPAAVPDEPAARPEPGATPAPTTESVAPTDPSPAAPQPAAPTPTLPQLPPLTLPTVTLPPPTVELPPLPPLPPIQVPQLPQLPPLPGLP